MSTGQRGLFISFEGNDGSGKTTQIKLLSRWFSERGREVLEHREPGGTPIGERIRALLLDNSSNGMEAITEMLLYAASRAQLVQTVVRPAIARGAVIICDRFVDSSYAYQGFGRELGLEKVRSANKASIDGIMPDITFFLDLDADTSMSRRNASGVEADRLENEEMTFHRRVYYGYLQLCSEDKERIKRIQVMDEASQRSPDSVFAEILVHMQELLGKFEGR